MNTWGDFIFALVLRLIGGVVLGVLASVLLGYRVILKEFSHDEVGTVVVRLALWGVVGGIICMFTTPRETWPWRRSRRSR
jgi:hypothetical protein